MYWDVVEVKPESDYCLFVRFKDGLAGRVRLERKDLTGVLSPLLDAQFFERVFIDAGAVAWPGDIDLAPDAMYAQVAGRFQRTPQGTDETMFRLRLPRFYELKDLLGDTSDPDAYFHNFEERLSNGDWLKKFADREKKLETLDPDAWHSLKSKVFSYLDQRDSRGRGWQQLFDILGEASAYNYLKDSVGCSNVWFIPESKHKTPELEGVVNGARVLCEVKTINISDVEVQARHSPPEVRKAQSQLDEGFLRKVDCDIAIAKRQLETYDPTQSARHLVYLNMCFDDWVGHYWEDYREQIQQHLSKHRPSVDVVMDVESSAEPPQLVAQK